MIVEGIDTYNVIVTMYEAIVKLLTCRDTIAYGLSALSYSLPEVIKVLAEVVWRPQFNKEQVGMPYVYSSCCHLVCYS